MGGENSDDADPRWAVAFGLNGSDRMDSTGALIRLTEDVEPEVRNWATFGLGNAVAKDGPSGRLGTRDSEAIREALRKRLSDPCGEARGGDLGAGAAA